MEEYEMRKIEIADITLRSGDDYSLNFKEKVETARLLDKLNADVIETARLTGGKTDIVLLHTISGIVKNSMVCVPVSVDENEIEAAAKALRGTPKAAVNILAPVSTVQMEYLCHKKPQKMLEAVASCVKKAAELFENVEISLLDSTRAEHDFLVSVTDAALENGAKTITICDDTGEMLPSEFGAFVADIKSASKLSESGKLAVACSNALHMAAACAAAAVQNGADIIKTSMLGKDAASLKTVAGIIRAKGAALNVCCNLNMTVLDSCVKQAVQIAEGKAVETESDACTASSDVMNGDADIKTVSAAVEKLGYDLSEDDIKNVYAAFVKTAAKKDITERDLDAIVASEALQVPPTYKIESFVANIGNVITPMAHIKLIKNGEELSGYNVGDGPIDAAFRAIEQIVGHHFELDDFQIQAVTRGREALGSAIVKLRSNGKLYSGRGLSTDIVDASINAYINALNKICFEEEM